ncbi:hypothetical protein SUDANB105_07331 [Streptomyces sp. enrichment culture]
MPVLNADVVSAEVSVAASPAMRTASAVTTGFTVKPVRPMRKTRTVAVTGFPDRGIISSRTRAAAPAAPALAQGRRGDILAWNSLAAALVTDSFRIPEKQRNYPRIQFTDPAIRTLHTDREASPQISVAQLRMDAAKYPGDPRLIELVGELSMRDLQFAQWWGEDRVAARTVGTKTPNSPGRR